MIIFVDNIYAFAYCISEKNQWRSLSQLRSIVTASDCCSGGDTVGELQLCSKRGTRSSRPSGRRCGHGHRNRRKSGATGRKTCWRRWSVTRSGDVLTATTTVARDRHRVGGIAIVRDHPDRGDGKRRSPNQGESDTTPVNGVTGSEFFYGLLYPIGVRVIMI